MVDWLSKISGEAGQEPKKRDWLNDMAGLTPVQADGETRLLQTEEEPTGQVSTITGQPKMMPVSAPHETAGFGTMVETGIVDDPGTKMDILSARMGIPRGKFTQVEGQIVYQGDDGNLYYAEPRGKLGTAKRGLAGMVSRVPEEVMATIGGGKRSLLGGLGAAGGAGYRKVAGKLLYDEPQTSLDNIKEMAIAGGLGYLGGKIGEKVVGAHDVVRAKGAAKLTQLAKSEMTPEKLIDIRRIEGLADKYGIQLFTPQSTKSHELIARFELLGNIPVTADKIGMAKLKQYGEINNAINKWLGTFGPATTTPESAGKQVVKAAQDAIFSAKTVRANKARPLYEKAFSDAPDVDIKPVIDFIDTELKTAKAGIRNNLLKAKKSLMVPDLPKKGKGVSAGEQIDIAQGRLPEKIGEVSYDTTLKGLHASKMELDDIIAGAKQTGLGNTVKRNYSKIRELLLDQMDTASPEYKKARKIFAGESEVFNQLSGKKRMVGKLAKLEGDDIEKAAKIIFSPTSSSPEILKRVKPAIIKQGGQEAWDAAIRVHMMSKFRDTVKSGTGNLGGALRKKIFGDINQRKILKESMTDTQYKNYWDLMEVLERTGLTSAKESATAGKLISAAQMAEEAGGFRGKVQRVIGHPLYSWKRAIVEWRAKLRTEEYQKMLADVMLKKKTTEDLQRLVKLKPGSQQLIRQLSTFLALGPGGETLRQRRVKEIELSR